jgi:hypothetical protein
MLLLRCDTSNISVLPAVAQMQCKWHCECCSLGTQELDRRCNLLFH